MQLNQAFETPEAKRRYNARLFDTIAPRYDFITRLLSYGRDQAWKRQVIELAAIAPGETVVDLACGTGDLAAAAAARGARVVGLDLVPRMIGLARERNAASGCAWLVGDMTTLPLATGSADVITTGYGLRNVPRIERALDEAARVLRPGGRFVSLDFDRPPGTLLRRLYLGYLTLVGSAVGLVLHGDPDTYRYIAASLARYPGAAAVAALLRDRGFHDVRHIPVLGGLMALHYARKP